MIIGLAPSIGFGLAHRLRIIRKHVTWVIMFGTGPNSDHRIFIIRTQGYGTLYIPGLQSVNDD